MMLVSKKRRLKEKTLDKVELNGEPSFIKLISLFIIKEPKDQPIRQEGEIRVAITTKFMEIYSTPSMREQLPMSLMSSLN